MILFSSALELEMENKLKMPKLIIDAAKDKVFFMIIDNNNIYNITHENSKNNYEKLTLLINEFLKLRNLNLEKISEIYVNRGPGSFAGKAIHLVNKIDYYCFSFDDFGGKNEENYKDLPKLCEKFKVKKNLINPIYLS